MNTSEFQCPRCKGLLSVDNRSLICRDCQSTFDVKDGIIDFRCFKKKYYFNPVPIDKMIKLISRMSVDTWAQSIRSFLSYVNNSSDWMDNLVQDGRYAWKTFLNLTSSSVVLDLGCGLGNLTHNIAPHVKKTYAMDLTWQRLEFANKRVREYNPDDEIILMAAGDSKYLPFPNGTLDCIILSGVLEWIPDNEGDWSLNMNRLKKFLTMLFSPLGKNSPYTIQLEFLKEINRILKPEGEIFIAIENRFNYEYFRGRPENHTHLKFGSLLPRFLANIYSILIRRRPHRNYIYSMYGYKHLLRSAGFKKTDFYGLYPGYTKLEEIFPLSPTVSDWHQPPPSNFKEKIKRNKFFVPAYGILGYASEEYHRSLQDRMLSGINQSLSERFDNAAVTITNYCVTSKNKGVMSGSIEDQNIIIKLPFNETVLREEEQNVKFLRMAQRVFDTDSSLCPESFSYGEVDALQYFVEQSVNGAPLKEALIEKGRTIYLNRIEDTFNRMNPELSKANRRPLVNSFYDQEVNLRLEKLFQIVTDHGVRDKLRSYFYDNIYGIEVHSGLVHGDFSISNIILEADAITGIIDWGMFSLDGLPILDVLNYLHSVDRLFCADHTFQQTIQLLSSGQWYVPDEQDFLLCQYERCGIEKPHRRCMAYLYWLSHVTTQLPHRLVYDAPRIKLKVESVVNDLLSSNLLIL